MSTQPTNDEIEAPRFDNLPFELMAVLLKASFDSKDEPENQSLADRREAMLRFAEETEYLRKRLSSDSNTIRDLLAGITGIVDLVFDKPVIDESCIVPRLRSEVMNNIYAQQLLDEFMQLEYGCGLKFNPGEAIVDIVKFEEQRGGKTSSI